MYFIDEMLPMKFTFKWCILYDNICQRVLLVAHDEIRIVSFKNWRLLEKLFVNFNTI